jgi:four helix bundle protein
LRSIGRSRRTEDGGQKTKTEDGGRRTEDRRRKTEDGGQKTDDNFFNLGIMGFKFEKLNVWNNAMEFGEQINEIAYKFPSNEIYNLSSQIRRAVDSVALNIAEGSIGQSNSEQKKFIGYSIRSLAEVVTCLYKAKFRNYISENEFRKIYDISYQLMNMLNAFKKNIK